MRVVLDTNVLISALIFPGGPPEALFRLVLEGRLELVTSVPLLTELGRVLSVKFSWDAGRVEEAVTQVAESSTVVRPAESLQVIDDDPNDDRVLEAAAEGGAEVIVSGDRHILGLRTWRGIRILRSAELVEELGRD